MIESLKRNYWQILVMAIFLLLLALRIVNLGYSDYNTDEATVVGQLQREGAVYSLDYLWQQRKGPLQWIVAAIPFVILKSIYHEFWFRLPFALFNLGGIYFLYKFLKLETKNKYFALAAAFFVGINGFT